MEAKAEERPVSMNNAWVGTKEGSGVNALQLPHTPKDLVRFRGPSMGIKAEFQLSREHTHVLRKRQKGIWRTGCQESYKKTPRKGLSECACKNSWEPFVNTMNHSIHCPQKMLASQNQYGVIQGALHSEPLSMGPVQADHLVYITACPVRFIGKAGRSVVAMASTAPELRVWAWPLGLFSTLELGRRVSVSATLMYTVKGHYDILSSLTWRLSHSTCHMEEADSAGRGWQGIINFAYHCDRVSGNKDRMNYDSKFKVIQSVIVVSCFMVARV